MTKSQARWRSLDIRMRSQAPDRPCRDDRWPVPGFHSGKEISMAFDTRLLNGAGVLAAIVETGSFVRASEALGVTSSAISRTSFAIGEALRPFARMHDSHRAAWRPGAGRARFVAARRWRRAGGIASVRRAANRITMQGQFRKRRAGKEARWRQDADDARSCLAYRPIFPARRCRSQPVVAGSHQANGPNPIKSAYGLRNAHKPGAYWTNLPGCRCSPPRRRPSTRCRTLSARSPRRRNPFAWRRSSRRSSPIG